jgi:hypothetical protein
MDSRIVGREIKNEIWPNLREHGFTEFSPKTAWRYLPEQIHVVNFQSFSSYLAGGVGCTTFSFALNLGIYFRAIPLHYPILKGPDPSVKPQEYHCHFRLHLSKTIDQETFPRPDIWLVERDGSNLLETIADASVVLRRDGLPWFDRFRSLDEVLRLLQQEDLPEVYARRHSPMRKYMIGYIALELGRTEVAEPMISEATRELEAIKSQVYSVGKRRKS